MEGNLGSEAPRRPVAADTVCDHHLTRSNSNVSSLTAENCEGPFRHSKNVTPDECTAAWTNGRHNSYLNHLEMSFVEQLYHSKSVLARSSGHNLRDINISRKQLINLNNASNQNVSRNRCWQKSKCAVGEPIRSGTSADYYASPESKRTHHSKHGGMHCHPSAAKMPTLTWKQGKGTVSRETQTCSQESIDLTREGTGQNFVDEDNQSMLNSYSEFQAKRLKMATGDGSHQDQIVPSKECPPAE